VAQVVRALAFALPDGVEAQPVLGANPPEVSIQTLDGPQEHEECRLLQSAGQVGPPHRSILDQQPQLFDRPNNATISSCILLSGLLPFRASPFRQAALAFR
jgi:hypothetical protein